MQYSFKSTLIKESKRAFLKIPFNVWDTCGKKGLIPVKVEISGVSYECKLIPKGNGLYYIPVTKEVYSNISSLEEIDVTFKVIVGLSRINSSSPYSMENPIRRINSIGYLRQPQNGSCGHTCLAMLAGISVDEVIKITKSSKWQISMGKIIETLDYFGFSHKKPVYTHSRETVLPKCCILNVRGSIKSHLLVYYDEVYYDPSHGILENYECKNIISYIEIKSGNQ